MADDSQTTTYPVYFRDGDTGFYWSLDTCGLTLDASGVTFTSERETRTVRFSEIWSIRLQTAFAKAGETPIGLCQIRFGQYRGLTVYSGDSYGRPDEQQREHYIAFVRDLHRRIPAQDRHHIAFEGGLSPTRYMIVSTAMIAGALLFGLAPIGLLILKPGWETLGVAFASGGLAYAGWRTWSKNRPMPYSPDAIPDELLP